MSSERSRSRGREPLVSTGRGGAGNLRSLSQSGMRESSPQTPVERGRHVSPHPTIGPTHSGRGGAGNVRSPSRDPNDRARTVDEDALEAQLVRERRAAEAGRIRSSGRGGQGNFVGGDVLERSLSRERGNAHSSVNGASAASVKTGGGRGGSAGWGAEGGADMREDLRTLDEEDDRVRQQYEQSRAGYVSSGKGGSGNMHDVHTTPATLVEARGVSFEPSSGGGKSGRGGAGNFTASDERGRSGGGEQHYGGVVEGLKNLVRDFSRSKSRERKQ